MAFNWPRVLFARGTFTLSFGAAAVGFRFLLRNGFHCFQRRVDQPGICLSPSDHTPPYRVTLMQPIEESGDLALGGCQLLLQLSSYLSGAGG